MSAKKVATYQEFLEALDAGSAPSKPLASASPPKALTGDVLELESQVEVKLGLDGNRAIGDGKILRLIWDFFQAHPELLTIIWNLLMPKV